ncbi:inner membrane protein YhjD [Mycolicibacterium duvalii]|uniref:Inner membrane protein YhjD n=1 Tax=Mycolicibacterium duvalii TaxID=39688 RepID=A0A7I7K2R6_9MYCO|nr:inner membrane protein YhjD [Mycolicibacterium duvalii]MCV7367103.1 inner membrane protein YhjD [Mycolicibacterium duvalii]PEG42865.1 inner membrane protein YhjD [Mycolicibacterium duvalii]BBX18347.1 inner membrane protein YhjD [Mycolicibacterium duvalii]
MTAPDRPSDTDDKPGLVDRLRARMPWFDHVMRAQQRYKDSKGDFYAAGITYFTIFALFPLLMVGFAIGGFVLANQPELLATVQDRIRSSVGGDMGQQLTELMESAIDSRTSVGLIGLAAAAWAGLGWMANLREALSQMWGLYRDELPGFLRTKISDLLALLSVFVAIVLTMALTALGNMSVMRNVLEWFGIADAPGLTLVLRVASLLVSVLVSWLLFTFLIARLPRESVSFRSSVRAGLLAAVGFEIFKLVAAIYLRSVLTGPAGATFGPVLGLMVFAYITARLILFATAWAATMPENMREDVVAAPGPAVIRNRIIARPGLHPWQAAAAALLGAVGALSFSPRRRSPDVSRAEGGG